jgi:glycerol-3-phosphate dehydrogenase (NAD(P)+)
VARLAGERGIDMPICQAVHAIVGGNMSIDAAIDALLSRPFKAEG